MTKEKKSSKKGVSNISIILHLCVAVFGIIAFLTGDGADDYKKAIHNGFDTHGWLGLTVAAAISVRLLYGIWGPESARFLSWMPFSPERVALIWNGIKGLISLKLPDRQSHQYISGTVKTFGLMLFTWMALTGSIMFFFLEPGAKATGFVHAIKEMHEVGEALIPIYLVLHIGIIVIHSVFARQIWKPMVFVR